MEPGLLDDLLTIKVELEDAPSETRQRFRDPLFGDDDDEGDDVDKVKLPAAHLSMSSHSFQDPLFGGSDANCVHSNEDQAFVREQASTGQRFLSSVDHQTEGTDENGNQRRWRQEQVAELVTRASSRRHRRLHPCRSHSQQSRSRHRRRRRRGGGGKTTARDSSTITSKNNGSYHVAGGNKSSRSSAMVWGQHHLTIEHVPYDMVGLEFKELARSYDWSKSMTFARTYRRGPVCYGMLEFTNEEDMRSAFTELEGKMIEGSTQKMRCFEGNNYHEVWIPSEHIKQ